MHHGAKMTILSEIVAILQCHVNCKQYTCNRLLNKFSVVIFEGKKVFDVILNHILKD